MVRLGAAWLGRHGAVGSGSARSGVVSLGGVRPGLAGVAWYGEVGHGKARSGVVRRGRFGRRGAVWWGVVRWGTVW
jgi:hypothetical protein